MTSSLSAAVRPASGLLQLSVAVLLPLNLGLLVLLTRALGLAAFGYGLVHGALAVQVVLQGDPTNLFFLSHGTRLSFWAGIVALAGLLPLAATSFAPLQRRMGRGCKHLHRAGPWLTLLSALHTAWIAVALLLASLLLFLIRRRIALAPSSHLLRRS